MRGASVFPRFFLDFLHYLPLQWEIINKHKRMDLYASSRVEETNRRKAKSL